MSRWVENKNIYRGGGSPVIFSIICRVRLFPQFPDKKWTSAKRKVVPRIDQIDWLTFDFAIPKVPRFDLLTSLGVTSRIPIRYIYMLAEASFWPSCVASYRRSLIWSGGMKASSWPIKIVPDYTSSEEVSPLAAVDLRITRVSPVVINGSITVNDIRIPS